MKNYFFLIVAAQLLLAGCSQEKNNWQNAKMKNDIQTYEAFLIKYPQSSYKDSANYFIEKIVFDKAFAENTLNNYLEVIKKYPNNRFLKKLSKKGDEFIIDSLTKDYAINTELIINISSDNKFKSTWVVPPHAKINAGGLILEAGPEGYSMEKVAPEGSIVELNAENVTIAKDLAVYVSKNTVLICGPIGSKFKRLPDKKVSFLEGMVYLITIK